MDIKFSGDWYGRLGNNIISLINVIALAELTSSKITFDISHNILDIDKLNINFIKNNTQNDNQNNMVNVNPLVCYHLLGDQFNNFKKIIYKMHPTIAKKYILPIIKTIETENINYDETLIIHIRGGDIFNKYPHHDYVQPPLQYYERILDSSNYSKIIIISEDDKNPCIDVLIKKYKNVVLQNNSLLYDVNLMLKAKYIVASNSTLIYSILIMSNNIKKIYYNSFLPIIELNNVSIFTYDFVDYIKYGEWKNSPEQINLMLNFPHRNIKRIFVETENKNIVENMTSTKKHSKYKKIIFFVFFLIFFYFFIFCLKICSNNKKQSMSKQK